MEEWKSGIFKTTMRELRPRLVEMAEAGYEIGENLKMEFLG